MKKLQVSRKKIHNTYQNINFFVFINSLLDYGLTYVFCEKVIRRNIATGATL